jgi:hypothetical protein
VRGSVIVADDGSEAEVEVIIYATGEQASLLQSAWVTRQRLQQNLSQDQQMRHNL